MVYENLPKNSFRTFKILIFSPPFEASMIKWERRENNALTSLIRKLNRHETTFPGITNIATLVGIIVK